MDSDSPEWHSDSEFYYPDDENENIDTENIDKNKQVIETTDKQQQFLAQVHDFIKQRPENTKKKTVYDIIFGNDIFHQLAKSETLKTYLQRN